jgi:hypothetical protein
MDFKWKINFNNLSKKIELNKHFTTSKNNGNKETNGKILMSDYSIYKDNIERTGIQIVYLKFV